MKVKLIKENIEDIYPMSDIEKGMVFHYLNHSEIAEYHVQFIYKVEYRNFDMELLKKAFLLMMDKHPILRTAFNMGDFDEPIQIVYKKVKADIEDYDITHLEVPQQQEYIHRYLEEDRKCPFNEEVPPLWRLRVFRLARERVCILWISHHAILDGWSNISLMVELSQTVQVLKSNPGYIPEKLKCTYKEAIIEELTEKENGQAINYWKKELDGYKPFDISGIFKAEPGAVMKANHYRLDDGLFQGLQITAKKYHTTVNHMCLGAYIYMLYMLSYDSDITAGYVSHTRPLCPDGDKVLGCFLNSVPIRVNIPLHIKWSDYMLLIHKKMQQQKKYERLPLFEIASVIDAGGQTKTTGQIFDTLFNFMNFHIAKDLNRNVVGDAFSDLYGATNTQFDFEMSITAGHLDLLPKYLRSSFNDRLVKKLFIYFERILKKFIDEPEALAVKNEIFSPGERKQILYEFNDTAAGYWQDKTIQQLFEEQVERAPNNIAAVGPSPLSAIVSITYNQLNRKSNQLAGILRKQGVRPCSLVAVIIDRSLEMIAAVMGILKAGGAYVPMEPYLPEARLTKLLTSLEIQWVVTGESQLQKVIDCSAPLESIKNIICIDMDRLPSPHANELTSIKNKKITRGQEVQKEPTGNHSVTARSEDRAYVIFTSGSTGTPKGVVEQHKPVINVIQWVNRTFRVDTSDRLLFITSLSFDLSVYDIFGILAAGAVIRLTSMEEKSDPKVLLDIIIKEGITLWDSAPASLQQLVPFFDDLKKNRGQDKLRLIFLSGDWIPVSLPDQIRETFGGVEVVSLGGATEATIWSNYYPIGKVDPSWPSIPYGKPIQNAKYYILDKYLNISPIHVPGDLFIGGECLAAEYINDEELTAVKFIDNPYVPGEKMYRTGDMARWFEDGNMEFLGRKDYQVKIRGYRIELGEIESQLLNHQRIKEAVVLLKEVKEGNQFLCAYFSAEEDLETAILRDYLLGELPEYMVPTYFIQVDKMPLTSNGKLDRKALPEPEVLDAAQDYIAPRTGIEKKLVGIWSEVLGSKRENISISANFFEIGGHSLNATVMVARIHRELEVKLPLAEVFKTPTIRELSEYIKRAQEKKYAAIQVAEKKEYYSLSSAQKRLYVLHHIESTSTVYNIPQVISLEEPTNIEKIEETCKKLIQRHESLRTSFHLVKEEPVQRIWDEADFKIERLVTSVMKDVIQPFDLSRAPLLRVGLIHTHQPGSHPSPAAPSTHQKENQGGRYILIVDMHHIISDGISHLLLLQDFTALYQGKELPPLRIRYKDFSQWQNSRKEKENIRQQEAYWHKWFEGEIPVLNLPTDYLRPPVQSFEGSTINLEVPGDQTSVLKRIALAENSTLFMILLAIFNVLLSKLSSQEDIVIGTPIAGRRHADLEKVIGMFVNTLALRNYPVGEKTFKEFLREVKHRSLEAFENQEYQFEDLVEKLEVPRNTGRNPIFDSLLALQNVESDPGKENQKPVATPLPYEHTTSKFDLSLLVRAGETLYLSFEYCTKLFKKETIDRFTQYFGKIVMQLVSQPDTDTRISEIEILPGEEKQQLLVGFNCTDSWFPQDTTIHQLFEEQVKKRENNLALLYADHQVTYREINERANQLAHLLRKKGLQSDSIVGIMVRRSLEMVVATLAVLKAGGAYLPIDPQYPAERLAYILGDCNAKWLIKQKTNTPTWQPDSYCKVIDPEAEGLSAGDKRTPTPISTGQALAYVLYTSGSTGRPKGVMVGHRSTVNVLLALFKAYPFLKSDTYLLKTSFVFDVSVSELFGWFPGGGRLAIMEPGAEKDPQQILNIIEKVSVTHINFVPSMFAVFANFLDNQNKGQLSSLKYIFLAGEALFPEMVNQFRKINTNIVLENIYGPTEATIYASKYSLPAGDITGTIPIGTPLANVKLYILNPYSKLLPVGVPGELGISGSGLSWGYLNKPDLTAKTFTPHPFVQRERLYRTGDLARWLSDGKIEFLGRIDQQVKIRGCRIELGEIESQLLKHKDIKEAVVIAPDETNENQKKDKYICAYIVSKKSAEPTEIRRMLSQVLPAYMIPSYFIKIDKIPLTPHGKIDLRALPHPGETRPELETLFREPRTTTEKKIARIWEETLRIDKVGLDDNFFELGGNSLLSIQLNNRITGIFKRKIPVVTIFRHMTIRALVRYLEGEGEVEAGENRPKSASINTGDTGAPNGAQIAVIGMAGRFPGAKNIDEFWENLKNGVESISFFSEEELEEAGVLGELFNRDSYIKANGVLEDAEYFDAAFFGYIPAEAAVMDPQMRILHECAWNTLEDAGYDPFSFQGRIGLYAGASSHLYWEGLVSLWGAGENVDSFSARQLIDKDFLTSHISYKLDLKGPSITLQTACSTSLAAVDEACRGLLTGACHMALAGGVTMNISQRGGYLYQQDMVFSADGHCRAFDAGASGIVGGNGAAMVLLKPLQEADADGDDIYAVIKGIGINNDGTRKAGFAAPSINGQTGAVRAALDMAGVNSESIGYIETHGTGTKLGDPVEIEALKLAFNTNKTGFCKIGSVKTNVGHMDSAAGITGFIKTVLALKHKMIPPSLNFQTPNPMIDFDNSPFRVNPTLTPWTNNGFPLRAGVSSLGIGGTNVHVVLEEAPGADDRDDGEQSTGDRKQSQARGGVSLLGQSRDYQLIPLSAKTKEALQQRMKDLAAYLKKNPRVNLADAAYTLKIGRKRFPHRKIVVGAAVNEILKGLAADSDSLFSRAEHSPVIFMFSGQGSQYVNMGLELYRCVPEFQLEMDRCFKILEFLMNEDIKGILYPETTLQISEAEEKINHVLYSGPVKFSFEYALAKLLMGWGIKPHALVGHSFGEYMVACLAGVFSLEDALYLACQRGRFMEKTPDGAMMSIQLPLKQLKTLLASHQDISLAAVNAPDLCIVSGLRQAIAGFANQLTEKGHECILLNYPRASHSHLMEPVAEEFAEEVDSVKLNNPTIPYISGLTGQPITTKEATDPQYWAHHLRGTVQFYDCLTELLKEPGTVFIQVGCDRGLPMFVNRHPGKTEHNHTLNMVRHLKENVSDLYYLMKQIGYLWLWGAGIDWNQFYQNKTCRRLHLPTYPFQGKPYSIQALRASSGKDAGFRHLRWERKKSISNWFYIPYWKPSLSPTPLPKETSPHWLFFVDEVGLSPLLIEELRAHYPNTRVTVVKKGDRFLQESAAVFTLNPTRPDDYMALLTGLVAVDRVPDRIVHLWGVTSSCGSWELDPKNIEENLAHGLYSLCYLAQAFGHQDFPPDKTWQILVVTDGMQKTTGDESASPGKATVLSPVKIIPLEYHNILCRSVDIVLAEPGSLKEKKLIRQLSTEARAEWAEPLVAYRGNERLIPAYEPVQLKKLTPTAAAQIPRLRNKCVYLITGGITGIGYELARHLASSVNARLILTGRAALSQENEEKVQLLKELGAEVLVFGADAANPEQMQEVLRKSREQLGSINGVIHAAGLPGGGVIQLKTREMIEQVLLPKVTGTLVLDHLLQDSPLDFFLLCSSGNSIVPVFGQVDYCAANLFLDALAHYWGDRREWWTISVNWERWRNIGMSVPLEKKHKQETGEEMGGGITVQQGLEAFNRIMTMTQNQVAVSINDLNLLTRSKRPMVPEASTPSEETPGEETQGTLAESGETSRPRPELSTAYISAQSEAEKALAPIWQNFFGIEPVGINDDFFELGGDSLKAMLVTSKIHKEMNVKVPLTAFFKRPTIGELGKYITGLNEEVHTPVIPLEEKEYYPVSPMQKRLYILYRMNPQDTFYNIPLTVVSEEKITREKLETVFKKLIQRHESLRTAFLVKDDEPVQKIQRLQRYDEVTFSAVYHEAAEEEARGIINGFSQPFDLSQAPLVRAGLVKITGRYILMAEMHHIISDGTSISVLEKDFAELFLGKELSPLKIRYKDFSQWHKNETKIIKQQESYWLKEFAGEIPVVNLPTDYPRPALQSFAGSFINYRIEKETTDALKKRAQTHEVTLYMILLAICNILLAKLSHQEDVIVGTPAAGRYLDDLQPIIGMFVNTLALHSYPHREKTFNGFLQEIKERTLRAFENQKYPFEELVEKVAVNRDLSRNPLFDCMFILQNMNTDTSNNTRAENPSAEVTELKIRRYPRKGTISKFDLTLEAVETADGLLFATEFCTELFKKETVYRYMKYYEKLILEVLAKPGAKISELEIITEEEKKQLLYDFNETGVDAPTSKTLCAWFETQVENTPDHTALLGAIEGISITYKELNRKSNQLAYLLKERGVKPEAIVGFMVNRSVEMIIAVLAILKAGGGCLPLDPDYPAERITYMLKDSGVSILLTSTPVLETMPMEFPGRLKNRETESAVTTAGKSCEILLMDQLAGKLHRYPGENLETIHNSVNLFYVIYTSGSTGIPKGVILEHRNLANLIQYDFKYTNIDCSKILQFHTISFDASFHEIFCALLWGGQLVLIDDETRLNVGQLLKLVEKNNIKTLFFPMSFLRIISSEEDYIKRIPHCVNHIQTAGEQVIVNDAFRAFLKNNQVYLHNHYGPSETHVTTALTMDPANDIPQLPTIGKPISNTAIYIFDKAGNLTPLAVPGELYIAGTQVGRGYLNNPELTYEKFKIINYKLKIKNGSGALRADLNAFGETNKNKKAPGKNYENHMQPCIHASKQSCSHASVQYHPPSSHYPITPLPHSPIYQTGDLARWLPQGNIEFLGRIDKQIKIRGFRVEPGEIENRLLKHDKIQKAVVVAKTDNHGSQYLCAYVVTSEKSFEKGGSTAGELREYLLHHLPAYMVPSYFLEIKEIPLTPAGKVDKAALSKKEIVAAGADRFAAPGNEIEKKLAKIWSEVLGKEKLQEQPGQSHTPIGIDDNFFQLGGHSLNAMILANRVHKELEVILPLNQIFLTPTIRKLARFIQNTITIKDKYLSIEPVEEKEYYVLSSAQKRLYILQQRELASVVYNLPEVVPLSETPDCQRLKQTFRQLIQRHEILRTSFEIVNGELAQRIHDKAEFEIEGAVSGSDFVRPFDLSRAPLLRVGLITIGKTQHFLMVDMHHIISDAVSHDILVKDFIALYAGEELSGLRLQYKDFSQWQADRTRSGALKTQEEYWLRELSGELPRLDLPTDYPRPTVRHFEGSEVSFEIEEDKLAALRKMALEQGVTLYMVCLTLYNVFLSKLCGQEEIIIGTVGAGRRHADLEQVIGMFVNTLVMRNYPTGEKTFKEFLKEVGKRTIKALENQDYQFEDLVEKVNRQNEPNRNPLFDVGFGYRSSAVVHKETTPGKRTETGRQNQNLLEYKVARFDLSLYGVETANKLYFQLEYSTNLFKDETIKLLVKYFKDVIGAVLETPGIQLKDISIAYGFSQQKLTVPRENFAF